MIVTLLALLFVLAGTPRATPTAAGPGSDAGAMRLMAAIERTHRSGNRIFSMDIEFSITGGIPTRRRIVGVSHADGRATRILYVITWAPLLRGASLLILDEVAPRPDRMWVSLSGLQTVREVQANALSVSVPGTGLTYEDARGWISTDKYLFATIAAGKTEATIEARPRSDSLARILATSRLEIRVDLEKRVVTAIAYFDEAGNLARTYAASEFVRLRGGWYPGRVETTHAARRNSSRIDYRYASLKRPPPQDLFGTDRGDAPFLDRLFAWRQRTGLVTDFPDSLSSR